MVLSNPMRIGVVALGDSCQASDDEAVGSLSRGRLQCLPPCVIVIRLDAVA